MIGLRVVCAFRLTTESATLQDRKHGTIEEIVEQERRSNLRGEHQTRFSFLLMQTPVLDELFELWNDRDVVSPLCRLRWPDVGTCCLLSHADGFTIEVFPQQRPDFGMRQTGVPGERNYE